MVRLASLSFIVAVALVGCGSTETTATVNQAAEKGAIAESTAAWDKDKVEAFNKAHAEDGRKTPGQKFGGQAPVAGQASK